MDQNNQPIADAAAVKRVSKKPSHAASPTTSATKSPILQVATVKEIKLDKIRIDGGTQSRVAIDQLAVEDYAEAMTNGAKLPPATVFFDGAEYWLADGFHRFHAHRKIGALNLDADLREGTQKDAMLFSYGANQNHGLRRSTADKQKTIRGMIADFGDWSDSKIGRHVGVDHKTVAAHRPPILGNSQDASVSRMVVRNGKEFPQCTDKIGKSLRKTAPVAESGDIAGTLAGPQPDGKEAVPVEYVEVADREPVSEVPAEVAIVLAQLEQAKEHNSALETENSQLKTRIKDLEDQLRKMQLSGEVVDGSDNDLDTSDAEGAP